MLTVGPASVPEVSGARLEAPVQDDTRARRLLQCAQGAFQKWPETFAGFSAALRVLEGDRAIAGHVRVFTGGRVDVSLPHAALRARVEAALRAISHARTPRFFKDADGRFPISFEPDEG